jgi:hypothetical protein
MPSKVRIEPEFSINSARSVQYETGSTNRAATMPSTWENGCYIPLGFCLVIDRGVRGEEAAHMKGPPDHAVQKTGSSKQPELRCS